MEQAFDNDVFVVIILVKWQKVRSKKAYWEENNIIKKQGSNEMTIKTEQMES